jgi:hypothetical protein
MIYRLEGASAPTRKAPAARRARRGLTGRAAPYLGKRGQRPAARSISESGMLN